MGFIFKLELGGKLENKGEEHPAVLELL